MSPHFHAGARTGPIRENQFCRGKSSWDLGWQGLSGGSPSQNGARRASRGPHAHLKALCTGAAEHWSSFFLQMYTQHPTEGYFKCFLPRFVVTLRSAVMILSFPCSAGSEHSSGSRTEVTTLVAHKSPHCL